MKTLKQELQEALDAARGNKSKAARAFGIQRGKFCALCDGEGVTYQGTVDRKPGRRPRATRLGVVLIGEKQRV